MNSSRRSPVLDQLRRFASCHWVLLAFVPALIPSQLSAASVCADASLALSQTATVSSREIVAAVALENPGSAPRALEDVVLDLRIIFGADGNFQPVPPDFFNIAASQAEGSTGGSWPHGSLIPPGEKGRVVVRFTPTDLAPNGELPRVYHVEDPVRYFEDGEPRTLTLPQIPITIHPAPRLQFAYFLQQDVHGVNGFGVVEPFWMAMMVHNAGAGRALDVELGGIVPRVTHRTKLLAIRYAVVGKQLMGGARG